jgi:hypothetical protein
MDDNPDREKVIELLEKLGAADDAEVVSSARELHQYVSESGLAWDDLLVPDGGTAPADDDDFAEFDDSDDGEVSEELDEVTKTVPAGEAADDLKLIEQLLGRKDTSSNLREELEGYKEDIKEGDFTTADRSYLQALQKRLSTKPKARAKA